MSKRIDFEGEFHFLRSDGAIRSGYRPQHLLHENYQSSGEHTYPDQVQVFAGETARVQVCLIMPEAYPCCIWKGRVLSVLEGSSLVGRLTVKKIFNESLLVCSEKYKPLWVEPAHLQEKN